MQRPQFSILPRARFFSHLDAYRVYSTALDTALSKTILVDLRHVEETTTSALAQLVLLRRELRRDGRDLRLTGLRDRTAHLYLVNRLDAVLPLS